MSIIEGIADKLSSMDKMIDLTSILVCSAGKNSNKIENIVPYNCQSFSIYKKTLICAFMGHNYTCFSDASKAFDGTIVKIVKVLKYLFKVGQMGFH